MVVNYADLEALKGRLFREERVEEAGYGIKVTFGAGGSNIEKMVATVFESRDGMKAIYSGSVESAARKFLELVPLESALRHFERANA
jgi:hypothetical protein